MSMSITLISYPSSPVTQKKSFGTKMARKRLPIFHKVSKNLIKVSLFVSEMRKPIIPRLLILVKSKKLRRLKLLVRKPSSHRFIKQDYEFSASSTPLIEFHKRDCLKNGGSRENDIHLITLLRRCFGGLKAEEGIREVDYSFSLEKFPSLVGEHYLEPLDLGNEEEDSVDLRAERFIQKFYQEMRMQRLESL